MKKALLTLSLVFIVALTALYIAPLNVVGTTLTESQSLPVAPETLQTPTPEVPANCVFYPDGAGPAYGSGGGGTGDGPTAHGELTWASATSELVALGATRGVSGLGEAPTVALVIVDNFASTQVFPYYERWEIEATGQSLLLVGVDIEEFNTVHASERIRQTIESLGEQGISDVVVNMSWLILPCKALERADIINYLVNICEAEGSERAELNMLLESFPESLTFEQLCQVAERLQSEAEDSPEAQGAPPQPIGGGAQFFTVNALSDDLDFVARTNILADVLAVPLQQIGGERYAELLARFYAYLNELIQQGQIEEGQLQEMLPQITPFLTPFALDSIAASCRGEEDLSRSAGYLWEELQRFEALDEGLLCEIMGQELPSPTPPTATPSPTFTPTPSPTPDPRTNEERLRDALLEETDFQIEEAELRQLEAFLTQGTLRELYNTPTPSPTGTPGPSATPDPRATPTPTPTPLLNTGDFFNGDPLSNLIASPTPNPLDPPAAPTPTTTPGASANEAPRVVFIAAAGNSGLDFPFMPAMSDAVISVSTVDGRNYVSNSGEIVMPGWHPNGIDEGSSFAAPRLSAWTAVQLLADANVCNVLDAPSNGEGVSASAALSTTVALRDFGYLSEQGRSLSPSNDSEPGSLAESIPWDGLMSCPKDLPESANRNLCKDMSLENALALACRQPASPLPSPLNSGGG